MDDQPRPCREPKDIEANLKEYLGDLMPTARYASFDYCYNYFQSYRQRDDLAGIAASANLQLSCLHLGFYLASWGMLRGSTDLLQRSISHLAPLVETIANAPADMWEIDANRYSDGAWENLQDFARQIRAALSGATSDILMTKIMLGVFGSVPAFDTNFKNGSGLTTFSRGALRRVERFYREHADVIERNRVATLDFATGLGTNRMYSRAKVIDMIFFIEGSRGRPSPEVF
jgi:hypothetical protein